MSAYLVADTEIVDHYKGITRPQLAAVRRAERYVRVASLVLCVGLPVLPLVSNAQTMCPDGSFVSEGPCTHCPDGTFVGGGARCQMAPDGSFVPETRGGPTMAPDGSFVPDRGRVIMCPDGTFVSGTRCVMAPDGSYVGK
jgi:hypothetical protein